MGRTRKPLVWAADYTPGEELLDTEEEANMVRVEGIECEYLTFMVITDPTSFQEAAKHSRWKETMDVEIKSIDKN